MTSLSRILAVVTLAQLAITAAIAQTTFGANVDLAQGQRYLSSQSLSKRQRPLQVLPQSIDNRRLFPAIKDQAQCGSCTVYAATALLEATVQREYGMPVGPLDPTIPTLMEQYSIDCGFPLNGCSTGWTMPEALSSLVEFGATSWPALMTANRTATMATTAGYVPQRAQCTTFQNFLASDKANFAFRPFEFQKFSTPTLDEFKGAIRDYGAVATTMFWARVVPKASGVIGFTTTGCGTDCGGHAIVVAGYDDSKRAFLVRNSWGARAANSEAGYFWISYDEYSQFSASQFGFRDRGFYIFQRKPELPSQLSPVIYDGRPRLSTIIKGPGSGVVEAIRGTNISCSPVCSASMNPGSTAVLLAKANPGSSFTRWEGCNSVSGAQCSVTVNKDMSVRAVFTPNQVGSEFDPGLLSVLGDQAQRLAEAPTQYGSNRNLVIPRGISKYDTLTVDTDQILFDPSFVVADGRYSESSNRSVSALVVKYLQVPRQRIPATGALEIAIKRVDAASLPSLNGAPGSNGGQGGGGPGRGQCGGTGGSGADGGAGTAGQSGQSRQYDRVVAISIGTIIDSLGRVIPPEKVRLRFDFGGYDGGSGGNGGNGGNGGTGGQGGDGRAGWFDCSCGPSGGGLGGNGGIGGDGGSGGDAGHGAKLSLFMPQDYLSSIGSLNVGGGVAGRRGIAGVSGRGGSGGPRGSSPGICNAGGLPNVAAGGTSPANIVSNARDGLTGLTGDYLSAVLGRANEHADQLASVGAATDLLQASRRLIDARVLSIQGDRIDVGWKDLNRQLGPLTLRLRRDGSVLQELMLDASASEARVEVTHPGAYVVEWTGQWGNEQAVLASLPLLIPSKGLATNAVGSIWSTSGGRTTESIVGRLNAPSTNPGRAVDVYVFAMLPGPTGSLYFFLNGSGSWVHVVNFAAPPKYMTGVSIGTLGALPIVSGLDLSGSDFTGTRVYVGYGDSTANGDSFGAMDRSMNYAGPYVIR